MHKRMEQQGCSSGSKPQSDIFSRNASLARWWGSGAQNDFPTQNGENSVFFLSSSLCSANPACRKKKKKKKNTSNENSSQRIKSRQRITTSQVVGGRVWHTMHTYTYIAYLPQDPVRILVRQSFRIAAASDLCPSTDCRCHRCKGE
jgi:hypothetical protein